MYIRANSGSGGGGGDLAQLFEDAVSNGDLPFYLGLFSTNNWTTDKAYKTVYLMLQATSYHDMYIKCGNKTGTSAFDAAYNSPTAGNRIYRFDNVAQGTVIGTTTTSFYGCILAFE